MLRVLVTADELVRAAQPAGPSQGGSDSHAAGTTAGAGAGSDDVAGFALDAAANLSFPPFAVGALPPGVAFAAGAFPHGAAAL